MELTTTITADISIAEDGFQRAAPHIWAKQKDNGTRKLAVQLTQNGQAYTIPSGATAELRVRRIDGVLVTGACTIAGSTVTGTLSAEMLYTAGDAMAEIRLTQGAEILASQLIALHVQPCTNGTAHEGWSSTMINLLSMTRAQYTASAPHSSNGLYLVTETNGDVALYLGDVLITASGNSFYVICTQAEYDAIENPDENMLYVIRETT